MSVLDAHARSGADGFSFYPDYIPTNQGPIHGAFPHFVCPGVVGDYRGTAYTAGGWDAYADYEAGHLCVAGGMADQPHIWVEVIRVCQNIMGQVKMWTDKRQHDQLEKQRKSLGRRNR